MDTMGWWLGMRLTMHSKSHELYVKSGCHGNECQSWDQQDRGLESLYFTSCQLDMYCIAMVAASSSVFYVILLG